MNDRIALSKIETKDAFPLVAQLVFNEEVMTMNMGRVFTEEEAAQYFACILDCGRTHETAGTYAVHLREDGAFIGIGSLQIDGDCAEVEYMILPDYWNRGYATEIVRALITLAKSDPRIRTLRGLTDPGNVPSQRVLLKNGFAFESVHAVEEDGSAVNTYTLSL